MADEKRMYPPEVYSLTQKYTVSYTDIDFKGNLKFSQLLNIFQNISIAHGNNQGIFIFPLIEMNLAFVITNWRIVFHRPVKVEERLLITTWIRKHKTSWLFRNYKVKDENGDVVIDAAAQFLFINLETKRPAEFTEGITTPPDPTIDSPLLREKFIISKPSEENLCSERTFMTGINELDFSMHVNNSVYAGWAVNEVPMEIYADKSLKDVRIAYRKECRAGEEIRVKTYVREENGQSEVISVFYKEKDGKQVIATQINTVWV